MSVREVGVSRYDILLDEYFEEGEERLLGRRGERVAFIVEDKTGG